MTLNQRDSSDDDRKSIKKVRYRETASETPDSGCWPGNTPADTLRNTISFTHKYKSIQLKLHFVVCGSVFYYV